MVKYIKYVAIQQRRDGNLGILVNHLLLWVNTEAEIEIDPETNISPEGEFPTWGENTVTKVVHELGVNLLYEQQLQIYIFKV